MHHKFGPKAGDADPEDSLKLGPSREHFRRLGHSTWGPFRVPFTSSRPSPVGLPTQLTDIFTVDPVLWSKLRAIFNKTIAMFTF